MVVKGCVHQREQLLAAVIVLWCRPTRIHFNLQPSLWKLCMLFWYCYLRFFFSCQLNGVGQFLRQNNSHLWHSPVLRIHTATNHQVEVNTQLFLSFSLVSYLDIWRKEKMKEVPNRKCTWCLPLMWRVDTGKSLEIFRSKWLKNYCPHWSFDSEGLWPTVL